MVNKINPADFSDREKSTPVSKINDVALATTGSMSHRSNKVVAQTVPQRSNGQSKRLRGKRARQYQAWARKQIDNERPLLIAQNKAAIEAQEIIDVMFGKVPVELALAVMTRLAKMMYPDAIACDDFDDLQRATYSMLKFLPCIRAVHKKNKSVGQFKTDWKALMVFTSAAIVEACNIAPDQYSSTLAKTFAGPRFPSVIFTLPRPDLPRHLSGPSPPMKLSPALGLVEFGGRIHHLQLSISLRQCRKFYVTNSNGLQDRFQDVKKWHLGLQSIRLELVIPSISATIIHVSGCDPIEAQIKRIINHLRSLEIKYKAIKPVHVPSGPGANLEYIDMTGVDEAEILRWVMVCTAVEIEV